LDATLKYLYNPKSEFLICGDLNIDYLSDSNRKKQINLLLTTYNLIHTVNFASRIQNDSSTAIDNIFVDVTRLSSSSTSSIINGLSDHDAQFLMMNNLAVAGNFCLGRKYSTNGVEEVCIYDIGGKAKSKQTTWKNKK
jgi:hypothetical protein